MDPVEIEKIQKVIEQMKNMEGIDINKIASTLIFMTMNAKNNEMNTSNNSEISDIEYSQNIKSSEDVALISNSSEILDIEYSQNIKSSENILPISNNTEISNEEENYEKSMELYNKYRLISEYDLCVLFNEKEISNILPIENFYVTLPCRTCKNVTSNMYGYSKYWQCQSGHITHSPIHISRVHICNNNTVHPHNSARNTHVFLILVYDKNLCRFQITEKRVRCDVCNELTFPYIHS